MNSMETIRTVEDFLGERAVNDYAREASTNVLNFYCSTLACVPIRGYMSLHSITFESDIQVTLSDLNHDLETFTVTNVQSLLEFLADVIDICPKLEQITRKYMQFI